MLFESHDEVDRDIAATRPHSARTTLPCARPDNYRHRAEPETAGSEARDAGRSRAVARRSSARCAATVDRKANASVSSCAPQAPAGDSEPASIHIAARLSENDNARSPQ